MDYFPLKLVSQKTGLSPQLIRTWEARYQAVSPKRLENNRRVYSRDDLQRLLLLTRLVESGMSIGQVAHLKSVELEKLIGDVESNQQQAAPLASGSISPEKVHLACLDYISCLDPLGLDQELERSKLFFNHFDLIDKIIIPLMHEVGERWSDGKLTVPHEHMASSVVKTFLSNIQKNFSPNYQSKKVIVASPENQFHELGGLVAAITASSLGWFVVYLGANTPVKELAQVALDQRVEAVVLSLTYIEDWPLAESHLLQLKGLLPCDLPVILGGAIPQSTIQTLASRGFRVLPDIKVLREVMVQLLA